MSAVEKMRVRKKPARHRDIVLGCIDERLLMIPLTDDLEPHRVRLTELLDELRRSLGKNTESDTE